MRSVGSGGPSHGREVRRIRIQNSLKARNKSTKNIQKSLADGLSTKFYPCFVWGGMQLGAISKSLLDG